MSNYTSFDEIESQGTPLARGMRVIFVGALLLLSGVTSMAFFATYASSMFTFLVGDQLSPWMAAVTGVLCFELASIVWSYLRANDAGTAGQVAVANSAHWLSLLGGVMVTVIYMAMSSTLVTPYLGDEATKVLALVGMALIVMGVAGNFLASSLYLNNGAGHKRASHQADIRGLQADVYHRIASETARATLSRTVAEIERGLPSHASSQAQLNAGDWMSSQFSSQTSPQGSQETPRMARTPIEVLMAQRAPQTATGGGDSPEEPPEDSGDLGELDTSGGHG